MDEIPDELKKLYNHWENHTQAHIAAEKKPRIQLDKKILTEIDGFIAERMHIWHKRYLHSNPKNKSAAEPYTDDPILSQYRFCNIYRELDRQTIDIHLLLKPLQNDKDFALWLLNVAFCRFVCNPQTVKDVGLLSFNEKENKKVHDRLVAHERPKYGVAYIFPISTIQRSRTPTRESFFTQHLPRVIPRIATFLQTNAKNKRKSSVCELLDEILPLFGFNFTFHWTEILIDVAYQYPNVVDLYKQFPIGPGSRPTMERLAVVSNANYKDKADTQQVVLELINHEPRAFPYLTLDGKPIRLSAENWEGIGCEFRKYTNLKKGNGRRRKYTTAKTE